MKIQGVDGYTEWMCDTCSKSIEEDVEINKIILFGEILPFDLCRECHEELSKVIFDFAYKIVQKKKYRLDRRIKKLWEIINKKIEGGQRK